MSRRSITRFALAALGMALACLGGAEAHVPSVEPADRVIEDPSRSWAFYDALSPGEAHVWSFALSAGDPLVIHIGAPLDAPRVAARLIAPDGARIPLEAADGTSLEPATPYVARDVWRLDATAPQTGAYRLEVAEGERYSLGFGRAERFSPLEWARVPVDALRIHAWLGDSMAPTLLLYAGALVLVGARLVASPASPLAPGLAAALYVAGALDRLQFLARAGLAGAEASPWAWAISAAAGLPALLLAWGAWRARRAWVMALLGVLGLVFWAGLLLGPLILLAGALGRAAGASWTVRGQRIAR